MRHIFKQLKKEQVWPFFGCCTADSQTDNDASRHQLYNNGQLVLFSNACIFLNGIVCTSIYESLPDGWGWRVVGWQSRREIPDDDSGDDCREYCSNHHCVLGLYNCLLNYELLFEISTTGHHKLVRYMGFKSGNLHGVRTCSIQVSLIR